jgi:hypothetical protein
MNKEERRKRTVLRLRMFSKICCGVTSLKGGTPVRNS